jgi:uncharacterized RDD family membrane protein YckC
VSSDQALIELLRRRTSAGWIDVLILFAFSVFISAASGNAHVGTWTAYGPGGTVINHGVAINLPPNPFLIWVAVAILYYSVSELLTGQTIGKRLLGVKVIMVNGRPLGGRAVALRTIGRIIDVLPAFYLVGWIAMRGPHRPPQRLGDRIAGTTVVPVSHP